MRMRAPQYLEKMDHETLDRARVFHKMRRVIFHDCMWGRENKTFTTRLLQVARKPHRTVG